MRYILAIALALGYWQFGWSPALVVPCLLALTVIRTPSELSQRRRRGGWLRVPASPTTNQTTAPPAPTSSSSSPAPGPLWGADWQARRLLRDPSRLTERGWSTNVTVVPGENGAPHLFAGSVRTPDWTITRYSDGAPAVANEWVDLAVKNVHKMGNLDKLTPPCGCNDTAA